MWYWHDGLSWWGWVGMTASMVIFWGLVIWGIVALVRYFNPPATQQISSDRRSTTPESILAKRFARGEIDEQEYVRKQEVLRSGGLSTDQAGRTDTASEREVETAVH